MSQAYAGRKRVRRSFGRIPQVVEMPNLIEVQKYSYDQFLQVQAPDGGRDEDGLQAVFKSVFPISDFSGKSLLVLDQVSDPRNVGAILRAAAVFGAGGIILPRRNSPPPAGTLAKTASGALEVVPLVTVTNLARALETLHKAGYMSVGLDERGDTLIGDVPKDRPLAVVMGAEGPGLRRLTRETCDMLARLPVADDAGFATLNVATATAVTLYALTAS
ncbi:hypothetical protein N9W88_01445 [Alphaproteobacteria bacterium]|nr:hypothetical protein [Alphaproteobacteria bacterium]